MRLRRITVMESGIRAATPTTIPTFVPLPMPILTIDTTVASIEIATGTAETMIDETLIDEIMIDETLLDVDTTFVTMTDARVLVPT
jgi:hypothetical protein